LRFSLLGKRDEPLNGSTDYVSELGTKMLKSEKEIVWSGQILKETNFIKFEAPETQVFKSLKLSKRKRTENPA
jgi:hypothetical protein